LVVSQLAIDYHLEFVDDVPTMDTCTIKTSISDILNDRNSSHKGTVLIYRGKNHGTASYELCLQEE